MNGKESDAGVANAAGNTQAKNAAQERVWKFERLVRVANQHDEDYLLALYRPQPRKSTDKRVLVLGFGLGPVGGNWIYEKYGNTLDDQTVEQLQDVAELYSNVREFNVSLKEMGFKRRREAK
jgi:hypothetical protein